MKLEETTSPVGDLRYRMLRKMLRIVTTHGLALETISNWALGIVGIGGGFVIANIDKVDKHVSLCSRRWLFILALLSRGVGCLIKVLSGLLPSISTWRVEYSATFRRLGRSKQRSSWTLTMWFSPQSTQNSWPLDRCPFVY
jgi:hypothetical protein